MMLKSILGESIKERGGDKKKGLINRGGPNEYKTCEKTKESGSR